MLRFTAEFHGLQDIDGTPYLKMGDLLSTFAEPRWLMDVKMGVRCFEEEELASKKPRADLFERIQKMDAGA